jgi:hypothetical protein
VILFKTYGTLFHSPICQIIIKELEAGKLITAEFEYVCHHKGKSHLGSLNKNEHFRK